MDNEIAVKVNWCRHVVERHGVDHVARETSPAVAEEMSNIDDLCLLYAARRGFGSLRGCDIAAERRISARYLSSVNI